VAALIRQERRGPAIVAGYSMGEAIAQLLCHRHPDAVAGMSCARLPVTSQARRASKPGSLHWA
jgi:pimeloyl-ACP methyl ester carboxylesterase